jgi:RNA polymerase sigma-70 factor (ECF subfamily)
MPEHDPEAIFERISSQEALREALCKLTTDHREVIELAFFHEMSYGEIADVLKCPVGTVKSRMSYAKRHIIQIMDNPESTE